MTEKGNVPLRRILEKVGVAGTATGSPEEFLQRLIRIDQAGFTVRDILCLYVVQAQPGINGLDLATMVGQAHRTGIDSNIRRLIREGLIEDRRVQAMKATPNVLHVLPAGVAFWNAIKE